MVNDYSFWLRSVGKIIIIAIILLILNGAYYLYDILYSSYYDQVNYSQSVWVGRNAAPTRLEIFFAPFTDLNAIAKAVVIAAIIFFTYKFFRRKKYYS